MSDTVQVDGWLTRQADELAKDPDYVAEGLSLRLIEDVLRKMDMEGMSASELAEKMGVSRAYVSKVLNAPPNLTLRSLAAVAIALDAKPRVSLVYKVPPIGGLTTTEDTLVTPAPTKPAPMSKITTQEDEEGWHAETSELLVAV